METKDICARLRKDIAVIIDDLSSLRAQADPNDRIASHLIDRLLVATDNATACVVLAENSLGAPLSSVARSTLENFFAIYWASQTDENGTILMDAMHKEMLRIMRLNLNQCHAEIRHKETGAVHTQEILGDPRMAHAKRPPGFRDMADKAGLGKLYDISYGFMSLLSHGTATELLANRNQEEMITSGLCLVNATINCIYLIIVNRIREKRQTNINEFQPILKISLV